MKLSVFLVAISIFLTFSAYADRIEYGYNARGDYVPTKIDGEHVEYGYNARGDYVPTKIGNSNVEYGYNPRGDYVPTKIGR